MNSETYQNLPSIANQWRIKFAFHAILMHVAVNGNKKQQQNHHNVYCLGLALVFFVAI